MRSGRPPVTNIQLGNRAVQQENIPDLRIDWSQIPNLGGQAPANDNPADDAYFQGLASRNDPPPPMSEERYQEIVASALDQFTEDQVREISRNPRIGE